MALFWYKERKFWTTKLAALVFFKKTSTLRPTLFLCGREVDFGPFKNSYKKTRLEHENTIFKATKALGTKSCRIVLVPFNIHEYGDYFLGKLSKNFHRTLR